MLGFSVRNSVLNFTLCCMMTAACFRRRFFAILKAIEAIVGGPTLGSESYMISIESGWPKGHCVGLVQIAARSRVQGVVYDFWAGPYPSMLGSGSQRNTGQ